VREVLHHKKERRRGRGLRSAPRRDET
jgi:hypothetical protein